MVGICHCQQDTLKILETLEIVNLKRLYTFMLQCCTQLCSFLAFISTSYIFNAIKKIFTFAVTLYQSMVVW